jgi:N-hydroxyarylamine O-acetyltransferase
VAFDLDAYLERIGLRGEPTIARVHRAHATSIPFENLDPQRGVGVSLELDAIADKLVGERRGGYCFEQNLLLKGALEALGAEVELFLARVRRNAGGLVRPRAHLVLRTSLDGRSWHADVGLGLGGLLDPLPWGLGGEYEQSGWRFRVVEDGFEHVLQIFDGDRWSDLYGFPPHAVPFVDLETSNWWVSTHPNSPFVAGLVASTQDDRGRRAFVSDWGELALTEETPAGKTVTPLTREELPELLATRFGLDGWVVDAAGRMVPENVPKSQ